MKMLMKNTLIVYKLKASLTSARDSWSRNSINYACSFSGSFFGIGYESSFNFGFRDIISK